MAISPFLFTASLGGRTSLSACNAASVFQGFGVGEVGGERLKIYAGGERGICIVEGGRKRCNWYACNVFLRC